MSITKVLAAALLCVSSLHGGAATPPAYPTRAITLVVPFPTGGSVDAAARAISGPLAKALGQPVIVDNVGGGSGSIGAAKVARAKADGYTLLLGTVNETVLAPLVNRAVAYKSEDLVPVGKVSDSTFVLVGRQGLPARTIDELVEYARKNPRALTYATSGIGSVQHMIMETLQEKSGTSMLHIPYRGGSSLVADLLGGQVDLALVAPATFPDHIESRRVQAFGVISLKRDDLLKKVPTINEGKYIKGLNQEGWIGIFVPPDLPSDIARILSSALAAVLADPEAVAHLRRLNLTPAALSEQAIFPDVLAATRKEMRALASRIGADKTEAGR